MRRGGKVRGRRFLQDIFRSLALARTLLSVFTSLNLVRRNSKLRVPSMTSQSRRILFGITSGIALAHLGNFIYFPILVSKLGAQHSGTMAGFIIFLTYFGRLTASFLYQGFAQRLGNRNGIVVGIMLEAIALLLMGFTTMLPAYAILAFLVGLGSGLSFPGLKNILSAFSEGERPRAFSFFQMACQLGSIGGALLGSLFDASNMALVFSVVFALFVGYSVSVYLIFPNSERAKNRSPLLDFNVIKNFKWSNGGSYFALSSVYWFLYINFVLAIALHIPKFAPALSVSTPFWITGTTLLILQAPVISLVTKRLSSEKIMILAFSFMTLAFFILGIGRIELWVICASTVVVLGEILFVPAFDLWVAKKVPADKLAQAMGSMHFFRSFGNMAGTFTAGVLFDLSISAGRPGLNWIITGALAATAVLLLAFQSKTIAANDGELQT